MSDKQSKTYCWFPLKFSICLKANIWYFTWTFLSSCCYIKKKWSMWRQISQRFDQQSEQNNSQHIFVHCNNQQIIFSYWITATFFCVLLSLLYVELLLWFCTVLIVYTTITVSVKDHFNHNHLFCNECWDVFRDTFHLHLPLTF